jgi:tripartite ATP-independent transporter DctM subunit
MFDLSQMGILVGVLLLMVLSGVHIAVSLGVASLVGIYLVTGEIDPVISFASNTAYEAIRDYVFAVIPLFMLMGEFMAKCGAARDLFELTNRLLRWLPGRLAVATVVSNALFAFVTGVSIAAAAAFSKIAYPEMKRFHYSRQFSLGCISGSACLGMLIPPSVLMIVWGVITETAIGKLFIAGILPGMMIVLIFIAYIVLVAIFSPKTVGEGYAKAEGGQSPDSSMADVEALRVEEESQTPLGPLILSALSVFLLIALVLGGIWLGFFTPTEGAGVGAALSLFLALAKGMRWPEMLQAILSVGRTSAPLLLLLVTAQLYARVLSTTGVTGAVQEMFNASGLSAYEILALMILVWFVLGCLIDSISIILLTVPVFAPIAMGLGFDPLAFAIIGIIAIETGLLTPPFGILVFTVKAALPDEKGLYAGEIFRGALPYWLLLLASIVLLVVFPEIATWLPNLGTEIAKE